MSEVRDVLACDGELAKAYAIAIEKKAQIERSIEDLRLMAAVLGTFIADRETGSTPGAFAGAETPLVDALADRMTAALGETPPRGGGHAAFA